MTSVDLGRLEDYEVGVPRQVEAAGRTLVVVRVDQRLYALDDRCSHEDFSLAEGDVDVDNLEIECVRHGSMFSLVDGEALTLPATRPVASYDTAERDGRWVVVVP